jgi:hypothetical protein
MDPDKIISNETLDAIEAHFANLHGRLKRGEISMENIWFEEGSGGLDRLVISFRRIEK